MDFPIQAPRSGNTLALTWNAGFDSTFGYFGGGTISVDDITSGHSGNITWTYYNLTTKTDTCVAFNMYFQVLDGNQNPLDLLDGNGGGFSALLGIEFSGSNRTVSQAGPFSSDVYSGSFYRLRNSIEYIRAYRGVNLDTVGPCPYP